MESVGEWWNSCPRGVEMEKNCSTKIRPTISSSCPITAKGAEVEVGRPQHLFHASTPGIGLYV